MYPGRDSAVESVSADTRFVEDPESDESTADPEATSTADGVHGRLATTDRIVAGIPAYNEEIAIGSVILRARRYADDVIVVDDGSVDNTVSIARDAGATVLEHAENSGKGTALRTLFSHAQAQAFDALVVLDGDGQHVPAEIPEVAGPVLAEECDIAIGSRYIVSVDTETPRYRRFGQLVLDYLTIGSTGKHLTDTQSGFRAFSPDAVSEMSIRTDGMGVESEMIGVATDNGLDIQEVPIEVRYDGIDGQTYSPVQHGLSVAVFLTQLIRDRHPMIFFGLPAVFLLVFGGLLSIHTAMTFQTTGVLHHWQAIFGGFTIILGTICLFCGLVLSQVRNMIRRLEV